LSRKGRKPKPPLAYATQTRAPRQRSARDHWPTLDHECLAVSSKPAPPGWWTFAGLNRGAPLQVKGRLRTNDTQILLAAAVDGLGIVHLATWLLGDLLQEGKLVSLFPHSHSHQMKDASAIYAVRLPGRSHAPKCRLFLAHLREHSGAPPYWDMHP
jgi:DNA-binding transcriptional LysR family regulator